MKRVLIINGDGTGLENFAIRSVLECFGYIVIMYNIGRPQDLLSITCKTMFFNQELKIDILHLSLLHLNHTTLSAKICFRSYLPIAAVLIPPRYLLTRLFVRSLTKID